MQALFKLFFLISILNKGPQDVPYSRFLFISLLAILYVTDLFLAQIPYTNGSDEVSSLQIALFLLFATVVIYGVTYLLIRAHGYANRTVQTFTALIGVELVIKAVQIPIMLLLFLFQKSQGTVLLLYYMLIMTFGWGLVANVHIFKHALSISALRATLITLSLFALALFLNYRFYPGSGS